MTGRYTRKTVPLEVRGISRDKIDTHPLPETVDDFGPLEDGYSHHYDTNSYTQPVFSESNPYLSGRSSLSQTESDTTRTGSFSASSDEYVCGFATGRSTDLDDSIYSLGEDEFDRQASKKVRQLFEEIDSMLFEQNHGPSHLQTECQEWVTTFPHYRILGKQLISPQDLGFQVIPQEVTPRSADGLLDVTEHDISSSHAHNELSVLGQHVEAMTIPFEVLTSRSDEPSPYDHFEEEVFAEDGVVEDVIAVDYYKSDDDIKSNTTLRRRRGIPPVTPHACVKDNIGGAAFDYIWSESISWLRSLLNEYSSLLKSGNESEEDLVGSLSHHDQLILNPGTMDLASFYSNSRENSLTLNSSRLSDNKMIRSLGLSLQEGSRGLEGLLTVSRKDLQAREKSMIHDAADGQLNSALGRPSSGFKLQLGPSRPPSSFGQQRQLSAKTKNRRLPPMTGGDRARTPSLEDGKKRLTGEILQGHRLTTMTERYISSPPPTFVTNKGVLPPITSMVEYSEEFPNTNNLNNKHLIRPKPDVLSTIPENGPCNLTTDSAGSNTTSCLWPLNCDLSLRDLWPSMKKPSRASSAVHDKDSRLNLGRDKSVVPGQVDRPSTTHALYRISRETTHPLLNRSDTPTILNSRRASTPLNQANYSILRNQHTNTGGGTTQGSTSKENVMLNITGSSINPQTDTPGGAGGELEVAADQLDELVHSSTRWGNAHLNPQIRRAKQQHYNMPVR